MRWPTFILGAGLVDYWHAHTGRPTASSQCRAIFRTDTPVGRAIFRVCLYGGAVILDRHIVGGHK